MNADMERTTVRQILQTALDTPLEGIENPTRGEVERWDSLAHIEIVFMLEDRFDVRFSEEEIVALRSLTDIVGLLQEKHAA
jgi:acyl carrier protein